MTYEINKFLMPKINDGDLINTIKNSSCFGEFAAEKLIIQNDLKLGVGFSTLSDLNLPLNHPARMDMERRIFNAYDHPIIDYSKLK